MGEKHSSEYYKYCHYLLTNLFAFMIVKFSTLVFYGNEKEFDFFSSQSIYSENSTKVKISHVGFNYDPISITLSP